MADLCYAPTPATSSLKQDKDVVGRRSLFQTLAKPWSPCTGGKTVLEYLQGCGFPHSFRPLCETWSELGRPYLQTVLSCDLDYMALQAETMSLRYLSLEHVRSLENFRQYFRTYCSLSVELANTAQSTPASPGTLYDTHQHRLLLALESDRSSCLQQDEHDCLKMRLWGSTYQLSRDELLHLLGTKCTISPATKHVFTGRSDSAKHTQPPASMPRVTLSNVVIHSATNLGFTGASSFGSSAPFVEDDLFQYASPADFSTHTYTAESTKAETAAKFGLDNSQSNAEKRMRSICTEISGESKRRKEQNRIKSKRHRDRMICQRNLLLDMVNTYVEVFTVRGYHPTSALGHEIHSIVMSAVKPLYICEQGPAGAGQRAAKERRDSKAIHRVEELARFDQVNQVTNLLMAQVFDRDVVNELVLDGYQAALQNGDDLRLFLGILVHFHRSWDVLLEAEDRLQNSDPTYLQDRQPIADLLKRLGTIGTARV